MRGGQDVIDAALVRLQDVLFHLSSDHIVLAGKNYMALLLAYLGSDRSFTFFQLGVDHLLQVGIEWRQHRCV